MTEPLERCAKCGSTAIYATYEARTNRLDKQCRSCRHSWWAAPLDAQPDGPLDLEVPMHGHDTILHAHGGSRHIHRFD